MSLIITVYGNEGIVMASDSRTTESFVHNGKVLSFPSSDNTRKTFSARNGFGISLCGLASISGKPLSGFVDKFIEGFDYRDASLTVKKFAEDFCAYLFTLNPTELIFAHIAGFDRTKDGPSEKMFRFQIGPKGYFLINSVENGEIGATWDGESEVFTRLLKKEIISQEIIEAKNVTATGLDGKEIKLDGAYLISKETGTFLPESQINWCLLGLQDAVDFARFAIQTTIGAQRFLEHEKTVGGPIDVLVIKPDETTWLSQKALQ
jgi:hypothetical protein